MEAERYVGAVDIVINRLGEANYVAPLDREKGSRLVLLLYVILAAGVMIFAGGVPGVAAVLAAGGVFLYYARMTRRIVGGMTGDLAGYCLQLCEIWMAAAAVTADILWKGAGW